MNVNKFRVGNYVRSKVWYGYGQIEAIEVTNNNGFQLKVKGYPHEWEQGKYFDLEDITLTDKWLCKFGFIEEEPNEFILRRHPIVFNLHKNLITGEIMCRFKNYSTVVETVSQLQNLFYAIAKQELVLNE